MFVYGPGGGRGRAGACARWRWRPGSERPLGAPLPTLLGEGLRLIGSPAGPGPARRGATSPLQAPAGRSRRDARTAHCLRRGARPGRGEGVLVPCVPTNMRVPALRERAGSRSLPPMSQGSAGARALPDPATGCSCFLCCGPPRRRSRAVTGRRHISARASDAATARCCPPSGWRGLPANPWHGARGGQQAHPGYNYRLRQRDACDRAPRGHPDLPRLS
jgi:hypothetical protein